MPDATNVFDYNRYMYARGNPMQYTDPSGHCATLPSGAADGNDGECWRYANTILAQWDNTPDYWNERFYSKDNFLAMASNRENHADGFHDVLTQYRKSAAYQAWSAQHQDKLLQASSMDLGDYTTLSGSIGVVEGAFTLDDYGNFYFRLAYSVGTSGIALKKGDIFVAIGDRRDVKDIDQLNLSQEQKAQLMRQLMPGLSGGGSGGAFYLNGGWSTNVLPPFADFVEAGAAGPVPISMSFSPAAYTWYWFSIK